MKITILIASFFFFHMTISAQTSQHDERADSIYIFKCRLIDDMFNPPGCGVMLYAVARKFEIIESSYNQFKQDKVIIIIPCPEAYSESFLVKNNIYSVMVGFNDEDRSAWSIMPIDYDKEKLPLFWCREIKKLKK